MVRMRIRMEYKTVRGGGHESRKWVQMMSIRKRKRVRMKLKGRRELVLDEGRESEILGR